MSVQFTNLQQNDIAHLLHPFVNLRKHADEGSVVFDRGEGVYLYDEKGKKYLEAMSALWCVGLGFSEERLINALHDQMKKLPFYHIFGNKANGPSIDLAQKLTDISPRPPEGGKMHKVFFANSGSEATDSAIKIAWYYNNALGRRNKKKIISRMRAYHGSTIAAGSLTGQHHLHEGFDLPLPMILHTDCPHYWKWGLEGESEAEFLARILKNLEDLILKEGPDTIAAMIAEPIMGSGGVIIPPQNYFQEVQKILRKYDILLIADEIITGFCRTGKFFGCELFGIEPDILTFAKGMSSAYQSISAIVMSQKVFETMEPYARKLKTFGHGFTNSGHPAAAAVALETIKIYEERNIVGHVTKLGPYLQQKMQEYVDHPFVGEVRGVGFFGAIELVEDKKTKKHLAPELEIGYKIMMAAQDEGLIIRALGDVLIFCPPFIFTKDHIDEAFVKFKKVMDKVVV